MVRRVYSDFLEFIDLRGITALLYALSVYFITVFPVVFYLQGVYWDDWVIYQRDFQTYVDWIDQAGSLKAIAYLHYVFQSLGIWSYKLITVFLFLGILLIMWLLLKEIGVSRNSEKYFLVILACVPLFESRYLSINIFYTISIFISVFYFYLCVKRRFLFAHFLLFFAFVNNSLILLIPVIYILLAAFFFNHFFTVRNISFLLGTVLLFIFLKFNFYIPHGIYKDYNGIDYSKVPDAIGRFIDQFFSLSSAFSTFSSPWFVFVILIIVHFSFIGWKRCKPNCEKSHFIREISRDKKAFIICVVATLVGFVPYFLVGKTPYIYYDFGSRHFSITLIPLAGVISGMIYSLILWFKDRFELLFLATILYFCSVNFNIHQDYIDSYHRTNNILESLAEIEDNISEVNQLYIIDDQTSFEWVGGRKGLSYYEWGGIFSKVRSAETAGSNFFVNDLIFWSGEGCPKESGLYDAFYRSEISGRANNDVIHIALSSRGDTPEMPSRSLKLKATIVKKQSDCSKWCRDCGF